MSIKQLISNNYQQQGLSKQDSDILGIGAEQLYNDFSHLLDSDYVKKFSSSYERQFDQLGELGFVKTFSKQGLKLTHPSNAGLDNFLPTENAWVEYKNLQKGLGNTVNETDFKLRLTNGISKKIFKINEDIEKGRISKNQSVILCFSYPLLVDSSMEFLKRNRIDDKSMPIEFSCLCGEPFKKNPKIDIFPRYFLDTKCECSSEGSTRLCDTTYISAAIFSETITNTVFEDVIQDYTWDNDLIIIHNPNARNPIKHGLINSWLEYTVTKNRIKDGYYIKCKEKHETV